MCTFSRLGVYKQCLVSEGVFYLIVLVLQQGEGGDHLLRRGKA